jgi:hypothetical protein
MQKTVLSLLALSLFVPLPVKAQEEGKPVSAEKVLPAEEAVSAKQLELAKKMHEIWPIRSRIETAIDMVAQKAGRSSSIRCKKNPSRPWRKPSRRKNCNR